MMRFTLLGPMEVTSSDGPVTPTAPMQRTVLALLLLQANRVVRANQLIEELWADRPPLSARTTLQTYIYQLRKLFGPVGRGCDARRGTAHAMLLTRSGGYELRLGERDQVDVHEFEQLASSGRSLYAEGRAEEATSKLHRALGLWSGTALAGVEAGPLLAAEAIRLEESRKAALELRLQIDLQMGRHHAVVGELSSLVNTQPAHEGLAAKLMLALVRCGRRVDALDVYRRTREELVGELGLEPSSEIQRLHQAILNDEPELCGGSATAGPPLSTVGSPPAQLPPDVQSLSGRDAEQARLRALLNPRRGLGVVEVTGGPGVGKTTFALHMAHQVRPMFPDGQFYAHLGRSHDGAESVTEVLARFVRSCGVPAERLPPGPAELGGMFRTWTADRRVLVVLDDVSSAAQLQALQPSGSACAIVACSRVRLNGVPGATVVELPVLTISEGLDLLGQAIGQHRVDAEPAEARHLVRLCDHLPLALKAAATRLASRSSWPLARLVRRLSSTENVLAELGWGGAALTASVEATTRQLSYAAQQLFGRIGSYGMHTIRADIAAELLQVSCAAAEAILEELVDAHLVEEQAPEDHGDAALPGTHSYRVPALLGLAAKKLPGADVIAQATARATPARRLARTSAAWPHPTW